jgi:hypothetical protein
MKLILPLFGKQEVGIWRVKKRSPRYGVPIWSLWPHIRFLPSIVAESLCERVSCLKCNRIGTFEVLYTYLQQIYNIISIEDKYFVYCPLFTIWTQLCQHHNLMNYYNFSWSINKIKWKINHFNFLMRGTTWVVR